MIFLRIAAFVVAGLAAIEVERRLGRRVGTEQTSAAARTDELMSLATAASLAGGLAGSFALRLGAIEPGWLSLALGCIAAGAGIVLRASSMRTLGRFYTLTPVVERHQPLITTGPYRFVRHPGYAGILLSLLGLQLILGTWVALASMLFVLLPLPLRIELEERMLSEHFRGAWADYSRRTAYRIIPGLI